MQARGGGQPAGSGAADILARGFVEELRKQLGQRVYVENHPGAGSTIGSQLGALAAPDGYTLTQTGSPLFSIVPLLYTRLGFDPNKDFRSIMVLASFDNVLVVNSTLKANTVDELIAQARTKANAVSYCSTGNGTTTHLAGEMFEQMTGTDLLHVPYPGGPKAVTDLLAGEVNIMFSSIPLVIQHIKRGVLRPLAVTGAARSRFLPDVPTMQEAGLAGYVASGWFSLSASTAMPDAYVERISQAAMAAIQVPAFVQSMYDNGFEQVIGDTPAQMDSMIQDEIRRWTPIVKKTGLKLG